ncbi:hypothetical protein KBX37_15555 [Micromonospora sp. U56]|uniref:hypothetical protein n=1 Tax=Micromonospora sp. U56 TaxID=2824900 RepID=UPI001B38E30B|nr:hypothetical protein [Micromonospora sp. U56]MBQ0894500.1 hypothetical protein [Micromonospora sp. U56]
MAASVSYLERRAALPFLGGRYTATKGDSAQANGKPITVSGTSSPGKAIVAIGDHAVGADAAPRNRLGGLR